jgi:Tfp pilus assembly protein PilW
MKPRAGLTLIELLLAMIVGLVVITTATSYVRATNTVVNGTSAREDYTRKARFLGLAFRRDLGEAGVGIESLKGFGSVAAFNDTIVILKVPYEPNQAPAYNVALNPPSTTNATTNSGGSVGCGNTCLRLRRTSPGTALNLEAGMVARIQKGSIRRLVVVSDVGTGAASDSIAVTFRNVTGTAGVMRRQSLSNSTSGSSPGPVTGISNSNTTVQRLDLIAYWRDNSNNLWRATRIDPSNGEFSNPELIASNCSDFQVQLSFMDGTVADNADSTSTNRRYNQINAIIIRATLESDFIDPRSNGGLALKRTFTFRVQPRNLIYERNRDN